MKNFKILVLLLCAVFAGSPAFAAASGSSNDTLAAVEAGRVVRMIVTEEGVNLYNQPSAEGEVVAQASPGYIDAWEIFYFDAEPIEDKQDGSAWYKILFIPAYSVERRGIITQIDKIPESGYSYLYINSKFLKEYPFTPYDQGAIAEFEYALEYFKQGRPPLLKVGDGISEIKKHNTQYGTGQYRITPTLGPITLYAEPVNEAKTFELPEGSSIVDYREAMPDGIGDGYVPKILAGYIDMEEKEWAPVIDGKALQVIGWAEPVALDEIIALPFDTSELDGLGMDAANEIINKEYPLFIRAAEPREIFTFDTEALDWVLKAGGEAEGGPRGGREDAGVWFYAVNPEQDGAAKDLEPGILIYEANAERYSFLPVGEELISGVQNVDFSPNGTRAVVAVKMSRFFGQLMVYDLETLRLENILEKAYSDVFFLDDVRFAFTLVDDRIERPETAGLWGTSAALYDPSYDEGYVILKDATATESFTVVGLTGEGEITINVTSVKSEEDWEDVENQEDSEITVEIPAAG